MSAASFVQAQQVVVVNAASYGADGTGADIASNKRTLAPDSIGAAFGTFVTQNGQTFSATTTPLPTILGGVRLRINGVDAPLFFVAPTQINFAVPTGLADSNNATVTVINSNNAQLTGTCIIGRQSPGIFSIRANGQGPAAAQTTFDGAVYTAVFNPDLSERDVDAGTKTRPNILVFYGTGIRRIPAANPNDANGVAEAVLVTLQGVPLTVAYAGPAPGFVGLDQVNAILPPEAAGLGTCKLMIEALTPLNPRFPSNAVNIRMGGALPPVSATTITLNTPVNGELTPSDQIQPGEELNNRVYFFDAYQFSTTQANQPIAVDMRRDNTGGNQLDSAVLLYRRTGNQLEPLGFDDQSGSYGNGTIENTNNALLLMIVPQVGDYVVFCTSANIQPAPLGVGKYTLRVYSPTMRQINYGTNLTSETIAATDIRTSADTLFDVFWFNAALNDNVDIRMNSAAFASFFVLQPNGGAPSFTPGGQCASCGDGVQTGREAALRWRVGEAGIQLILATPYEPNKTGTYSLSLNRATSLTADDATLTATAPVRATPSRQPLARATSRTIEE
jgi:uncharacterized protein (TIGR03437 family)